MDNIKNITPPIKTAHALTRDWISISFLKKYRNWYPLMNEIKAITIIAMVFIFIPPATDIDPPPINIKIENSKYVDSLAFEKSNEAKPAVLNEILLNSASTIGYLTFLRK